MKGEEEERRDEERGEKAEQSRRKERETGKERRKKAGRVANESDNSVCRVQAARGMQPLASASSIHKFIPAAFLLRHLRFIA